LHRGGEAAFPEVGLSTTATEEEVNQRHQDAEFTPTLIGL